MANVLKTDMQEQVRALGRLGWSLRRIEQATGVHRDTVRKYLAAAGIGMRAPRRRRLAAAGLDAGGGARPASEVTADPGPTESPKPPSEVTTDLGDGGPRVSSLLSAVTLGRLPIVTLLRPASVTTENRRSLCARGITARVAA
jgi:hypothetical protein